MNDDYTQVWCAGEVETGRWQWGWQCFACGEEEDHYGNASTAREAADNHAAFCAGHEGDHAMSSTTEGIDR